MLIAYLHLPLARCIFSLLALFMIMHDTARAERLQGDQPRLIAYSGHSRGVSCVTFSPDGKTLASSSFDHSIKVWDVNSGRELRTLIGHDGGVTGVAFSPDGKTLASGSKDKSIKLWDVASGRELHSLIGNAGEVTSLAFLPDGKTLASVSADNSSKLWDVASGRELRRLTRRERRVAGVVLSPDGKTLALSSDKLITLWDAASGSNLRKLAGHGDKVSGVAFSSDGKMLASGSWDKSVKLWDVLSGRELSSLTGHGGWVNRVVFSSDGKTLASVGAYFDWSIKVWDVASGRELRSFAGPHFKEAKSVTFSPNGKSLASGYDDGSIQLWDVESGRELHSLVGQRALAPEIVFTPRANAVVSASIRESIELWNMASGRERRQLTGQGSSVESEAYSPDGKTLALASSDKSINLWDVSSGRELRRLTGHNGDAISVAFSPDGKTLASGSFDKSIKLWDVASGRELRSLIGHRHWVRRVVFSADGKTLASGSVDKSIKLWDVTSGRELRSLIGHVGGLNSLAFAPDGNTLASGSTDKSIKLWDVASGRELRSIAGLGYGVSRIIFSPDAKMLTLGSHMSIRLWDVAKGAVVVTQYLFGLDEFLVVDAEGRYDSSNAGQSTYLHWVAGMTPISLDQLKDRYYEPGLLAKVMGHNTEPLRPVPKLEDALLQLFPTVTAEQSSTQANRIDIALTDQGGGFGPVRVRVNGKEVVRDARQVRTLAGKMVEFAVDIDPAQLLPGENTIEVQAWNRDEILRSWPVVLTLRGDELRAKTPISVASNVAATHPSEAPVLYAIVAGVSRYADPSMNLSYSGKDASDFAQALTLGGQRLFGASKVKLHLLTDQPPPGIPAQAPSKTAIQAAFAEVARTAKVTDVLVLYLSGHGAMSGGADAEYHYLTREAQGTNLADPALRKLWGISSSEFTDWVKAIKTAKQVMVLDTCAAGGAVEKLAAPRVLSSDQIRALDRLHERSGFHILAGAAADKVSYEATRFRQGLLTYALLTGMKGAALRENEFVDVIKLFDYSAAQVPELAKGIGGVQRPQLYTVKGSSFDIGQLIEEDRRKLPVAASRPMLMRTNFQDEQRFNDHLKLSQRFNQRLAQENRSAARGSVGFVDADEFPDAWSVNGRYEVAADTVRLKAKLFYGGQAKGDLLLSLPLDAEKQVETLYQSVREAVK